MIPINFRIFWKNQRIRRFFIPLAWIIAFGFITIIIPKLIPKKELKNLTANWFAKIFGNPVTTITSATSLSLLLTPKIHIDLVQFKTQEKSFIQAKDVYIPISLSELLFGNTFESFTAKKATINPDIFLRTLNRIKTDNTELLSFKIDQLVLNAANKSYNIGLSLDVKPLTMGIGQVRISNGKDILILKVSHAGKTLLLNLKASKWQLSKSIVLTDIFANGRLIGGQLELDRITATSQNGYIRGALRISSNPWNISGSLTLNKFPVDNWLKWIEIPILTGTANGTLYISGTADDWTNIAPKASIFGQLTIHSGTFSCMDLITPVQNLNVKHTVGGQTNFNHLRMGVERNSNGEWIFNVAEMNGKDWNGKGAIRISDSILLDGIVDMNFDRGNLNSTDKVHLLISGTVATGQVNVSKRSLVPTSD